MIAVDTNILVYAHRQDSPWHERAVAALIELAEGRETWAIPWPCVHEFFSIVTHPRIYKPPTPAAVAIADLEVWFESPTLNLIGEPDHYWSVLRDTLRTSAVVGRWRTMHGSRRLSRQWSDDTAFRRSGFFAVRDPGPKSAYCEIAFYSQHQ